MNTDESRHVMFAGGHRKPVLSMLVLGALASTWALQPSSASALTVDPDVSAGVLLPPAHRPDLGGVSPTVVSPDYIALAPGYGESDEYAKPSWLVYRVADGTIAPSLPVADVLDSTYEPHLSGTASVQLVPATDDVTNTLEVRDVESRALRWTRALPTGQSLVGAGATWAITVDSSGDLAPLRLLRPGNPDLDLDAIHGSWLDGSRRVIAADDSDVLLRSQGTVWLVDISSGTPRQVAPNITTSAPVMLTPHRVLWIEDVYVAGEHRDDVHWVQRDGSAAGHVLVDDDDATRGYVAYGDRVAANFYPTGAALYRANLHPINLATGRREAPIASNVAGYRALGDGRVVAAIADQGPGHLTILTDGTAPRRLADLPPVPELANMAWLSGNTVVANFGDAYGATPPTMVTTADATTPWTKTLGEPLDIAGGATSFSGGTLLTEIDHIGSRTKYRITWNGGHRDVDYTYDRIGVVRQGRFVVRTTPGGHQVQAASSPAVVTTLPLSARFSIDGNWLWRLNQATGVITGTDLTNTQSPRAVPAAVPCSTTWPAVAGRWALLGCTNGDVYAVDLLRAQTPWKLPEAGADYQLGNGFVTHIERRPGDGSETYAVAVVDDLSPTHQARAYGPLHGRYTSPTPWVSPDSTDAHRLVYLDTSRQIRRVDLTWLQAPTPAVERTAPLLTKMTGTPRTAPTRTISAAWTYSDPTGPGESAPTGVATYDARYQQASRVGAAFGPWQSPTTWQATTRAAVTLTANPGVDTCFQVRARDVAGNASAWSASRCTAVDGRAPVVTTVDTGPSVVQATTTTRATVRYAATDAIGVRSYDVAVRSASAGHGLGGWQYPAKATTARSTTLSVAPGGQACIAVRARDAAGNLSPWSAARCITVPVDDRALAAKGSVRRLSSKLALAGTQTRLSKAGASLRRSSQTGSRIGVYVLRGPGQGAVDVLVGGRSLGRIHLSATTWKRQLVWLPGRHFNASTVTIRSAKAAHARIDALVITR